MMRKIDAALDVLDAVEGFGTKRKPKLALLQQHADNDRLAWMFSACYDWLRTYGMTVPFIGRKRVTRMPTLFGKPRLSNYQALRSFRALLCKLEDRRLTGNKAKAAWDDLAERIEPRALYWFSRVINRDLKIGLGPKSIAAIWPDMLNPHEVQLAHTYYPEDDYLASKLKHKKTSVKRRPESKVLNDDWWSFPLWIEPKYDGIRHTCITHDGVGRMFSRAARDAPNVAFIAEAFAKVAPDFVIDGETLATDRTWNSTSSVVGTSKNYSPEKLKDLSKIGFVAFDCIKRRYFAADYLLKPGSRRAAQELVTKTRIHMDPASLRKRRRRLKEIVKEVNELLPNRNVRVPPVYIARSEEDIQAKYDELVGKGYEGVMLKYPSAPYLFDRNSCWLKFKPHVDVDGTLLEVLPGKRGTRLARTMGRVLLELEDGSQIFVGSGFTDEQRAYFWKHREELPGATLEFRMQKDPTQVAEARFPRFIRIRSDR